MVIRLVPGLHQVLQIYLIRLSYVYVQEEGQAGRDAIFNQHGSSTVLSDVCSGQGPSGVEVPWTLFGIHIQNLLHHRSTGDDLLYPCGFASMAGARSVVLVSEILMLRFI